MLRNRETPFTVHSTETPQVDTQHHATEKEAPTYHQRIWSEITEYQVDPELSAEISRLEEAVALNPVFRCPNPLDLLENFHALSVISQRSGIPSPEDREVGKFIQRGIELILGAGNGEETETDKAAQKFVNTYYDYDAELNRMLDSIETTVANSEARAFQLRVLAAIFEQTVSLFQPDLGPQQQQNLVQDMLARVRFDARYRFPYGGLKQPMGGVYPHGRVYPLSYGGRNYSTIDFPSTLFIKREKAFSDAAHEDYLTAAHEPVHLLKALGVGIDDSVVATTYGLLAGEATGYRSIRMIGEVVRTQKALEELRTSGVTEPTAITEELAKRDPGEKYLLGAYYYLQIRNQPPEHQPKLLRELAQREQS